MVIAMYFDTEDELPESGQLPIRLHGIRDVVYELEALGADFVLVADSGSYVGEGQFMEHWRFGDAYGVIKGSQITADVVFKQGNFRATDVKTINHNELYDICNDKYLTQRMFSQFYPRTMLVDNPESLKAALSQLEGLTKVLKSTVGSYSKQVWIGNDAYLMTEEVKYPLLAQEFIDSSNGISGLTPGEHDLRIVMLGSTPGLILLRIPAFGEHRAGLNLGASFYFADIDQLPLSVKHMVSSIDSEFTAYVGRVYSIDCAMTAEGPKIIELNKEPAIWPSSENLYVANFNKALAAYLLSYSQGSQART